MKKLKMLFVAMVILVTFGLTACGDDKGIVKENETEAETKVEKENGIAFEVEHLKTHEMYAEVYPYPVIQIVRSKQELQKCWEEHSEQCGFDQYDETFFEKQSLVLIWMEGNSGSIEYRIRNIEWKNLKLMVHIDKIVPDVCTDDLVWQYLFIAVHKENIPENVEDIKLDISVNEAVGKAEDETVLVRYYKMSDGTWRTDEYSYKYRLEVSGRMHNAAGESTYVILSNRSEISFDEAWKASGFSSNMDDYFDPNEAVIVGSIFHSDQKTSELQAEGVDTSILVRFHGSLYGRSFAMIDYAGGGEAIGKIERRTEKENIPMVDGETNTKELLGALIYESTSDSIVLFYNNEYVLFEKIEHLESVEFSRDLSVADDLLYRGESLDIRKLEKTIDSSNLVIYNLVNRKSLDFFWR